MLTEDEGRIGALRALAQVIASGALRKEEARVIAEFLPNVMDAIAAEWAKRPIAPLMQHLHGDGASIPARHVTNALLSLRGPDGD